MHTGSSTPPSAQIPALAPNACRHVAYRCSAERRGAAYVLVCPCGHVRVCVGDIEAMVWARVDQAALARELRRQKNEGVLS